MSDGIYIGMSGAVARTRKLDAVADNLANAQTPGFKAARPGFAAFLPPEGGGDKVYAAAVGTGLDLRAGPTSSTGNPMDLVVESDALLVVQRPDGSPAFTRDGRIRVDANGMLTAAGLPLLGTGGQPLVAPPETRPEIGADGKVRAGGLEIGRIALVRVEGALERLGGSLLQAGAEAQVREAPDARVRTGELELANATPLEATVELINAQRGFDHAMQAIQTYRKIDERLGELGRVR